MSYTLKLYTNPSNNATCKGCNKKITDEYRSFHSRGWMHACCAAMLKVGQATNGKKKQAILQIHQEDGTVLENQTCIMKKIAELQAKGIEGRTEAAILKALMKTQSPNSNKEWSKKCQNTGNAPIVRAMINQCLRLLQIGRNKDAKVYRHVSLIIKRLTFELTLENVIELSKHKGVGKRIIAKVSELIVLKDIHGKKEQKCDAATTKCGDCIMERERKVSFRNPSIVTDVFYRPKTLSEDKPHLYYTIQELQKYRQEGGRQLSSLKQQQEQKQSYILDAATSSKVNEDVEMSEKEIIITEV